MQNVRKRKYRLLVFAAGVLVSGYFLSTLYFSKVSASQDIDFDSFEKKITILENGLQFNIFSKAKTVKELLSEQKINFGEHDSVFPGNEEKIFSGTTVIVNHAKKVIILEGGKKKEVYSTRTTVEGAIWDQENIGLGEDDFTTPARSVLIKDGMEIKVTHVLIKEEIKDVPIDFKIIENEDSKLSWREKKITQKGEKGNTQVKYKVLYNDGKEISRKIMEKNITKNPVEEIVTQGSLVKIGKVHTGVASWYAYTGTMAAANPWLPMGSYVRVTNKDNGKNVIVKINDRGPFGNGRIIDLDKVAFAKIASIGAGVVNVKMEVIVN